MDNTALDYYLNLIEAGVKDAEARTQVKALATALGNLATKDELLATKEELKTEIKNVKSELKYFMVYSILGFIYAPIIVGVILKYFGMF